MTAGSDDDIAEVKEEWQNLTIWWSVLVPVSDQGIDNFSIVFWFSPLFVGFEELYFLQNISFSELR